MNGTRLTDDHNGEVSTTLSDDFVLLLASKVNSSAEFSVLDIPRSITYLVGQVGNANTVSNRKSGHALKRRWDGIMGRRGEHRQKASVALFGHIWFTDLINCGTGTHHYSVTLLTLTSKLMRTVSTVL